MKKETHKLICTTVAKKMIKLEEIEVMGLKQSHNLQGGDGSEGDLRNSNV